MQPVEDVITTGGSTLKTIEAIKGGNLEPPDFYPRVAAIINRSGLTHVGDFEIVSLLSPKDIKIYIPDECPMCKEGSKVVAMKPWLIKKYGKIICEQQIYDNPAMEDRVLLLLDSFLP